MYEEEDTKIITAFARIPYLLNSKAAAHVGAQRSCYNTVRNPGVAPQDTQSTCKYSFLKNPMQ